MKKTVSVIAIAAGLLAAGCVSDTQWTRSLESYDKYVDAVDQTFQPLCIKGTNLVLSVSGATEIAVTVPLNEIAAAPVPYDPAKDVIDGVKTVSGYGAGAYLGGKAIGKINDVKVVSPANGGAAASVIR